MATMNPQEREEKRYTAGIANAPTVSPDYAEGSNGPVMSSQALASAQFGSGSPVTTFDYSSPKSSAPAKKTPAKRAPSKPNVSRDVAKAKAASAVKVGTRPKAESYSVPNKSAASPRPMKESYSASKKTSRGN